MAYIKLKFRPSANHDEEGTIYYQITHSRTVRYLPTHYQILPSEWDYERAIVVPDIRLGARVSAVITIADNIRREVERLNKIISKLDSQSVQYCADDVINRFKFYTSQYTLFKFMNNVIATLKQNGKERTSETYIAALNSFSKFRQGKDILLDHLSSKMMESYQAWLEKRGIVPNTISFYNRILRAVYNRAVNDEIIDDRKPFRHVYTGIDKTVKRALPLEKIKLIKALQLEESRALDFARDMFMLSFMLRGMSFIDMAYLRKIDLNNSRITYRRRKTGQLLSIEWTLEMQKLLEKYPENQSPYLLPIIKSVETNQRYTYRNTAYNINRSLKIIAQKVGIDSPLTLYVARHSWASIAKAKGIPISVISEGMGLQSETTTLIYLASLDTNAVDRANSIILDSL